LRPISNASNVVETRLKFSSLFLLCSIEVSHPGFITSFFHLVARCLIRCLPLLSATGIIGSACYCIKPRAVIFLLFSLPPTHTMSREFSFLGAVSKMSWDPVFRFVKQIPRGRVLTYGALAKALRLPGGARSAGRAMAATPSGRGIPWHRVIGERGKILIREPYASLQRKLLESEGVTILESRVDLKRHLWKPPVKSKVKHRTRKKRIQK
jgi:methylated-DNA-protein-cysteine methyltransferase related protein